ncbi:MAG: ribosome assembly cofactor RimP [Flavobacteriales bacterium]|jgi:ribosome maturation factor RimP|tara:strand:+ start:721 stop:1194 length:474 start_codon:yes stop_codon:yes gene_type:complete
MIAVKEIEDLISQAIEDTSIFLISCEIKPGNVIAVLIDNENDASIVDCMKVSRGIEHNLDRESEDFSLSVSSPGLTEPFLVKKQYVKNIGRRVTIKSKEGDKIEGLLEEVTDEGVRLTDKVKERIEGRKSKHWVDKEYLFSFEDIKETKVVISFKKN